MTTIQQQLDEARRLLASYQELATDQIDDDSFVARGNGFCDRKYSDEFIDMQISRLAAQVADLTARAALEEDNQACR